ncbi:MAG: peptidylprolyl isomerase [Persicimonas sp.]
MNYRRIAAFCLLAAGLCLQPACASSNADEKPDERPALTEAPADEEPDEADEADEADADAPTEEGAQVDDSDGEDAGERPAVHAVDYVAIVDGEKITAEAFNAAVERQSAIHGGRVPAQVAQMLKTRILDRLIDETLINRALEQNADAVSVEDAEVDAEFQKFRERFPTADAFEAFLERNGVDQGQMRENLRKDLSLRKLLSQDFDTEVGTQEARDYYDDNIRNFEEDDQVRARHILIELGKDASEEEVEKARLRAAELSEKARQSDVDFAELAREHSEGPSATRGGDLGFFTKRRMVPEFSDAAFAMSVGEVSDPVQSQFGFHVILVEEKKKAQTTPFSEAEEEITTQLERKKFRGAMKEFLADLEADADIERFEDHIEVNVRETNAAPQGQNGLPPGLQKKLQKQLQQKQQNSK